MSITFSKKQLQTIRAPFDYTLEVNEGTPRSGKTTAGIFRYARYLIESPDEQHLICAYNQEQAYRLFIEGDGLGLKHIFQGYCKESHDSNGDHLQITTPTGIKKVFYKGAGKADSVKAITGMSLGSIVFCEINLLHMKMIQECFRRTFAAKMRYHLADLNPPAPNHPVISEVFDVQKTKWQHWTIEDNPIITEERKQEIYETVKKNPYLYKRDWLGKRVMPEGVIYSMFDMDKHSERALLGKRYELYFAADVHKEIKRVQRATKVYKVRKGDSLSKIAAKYNTSVNHIMSLNHQIHNPNVIYPGEKITILKGSNNDTRRYHDVVSGDTLSGIASKNHTTVQHLLQLNPNIDNPNKIFVHEKIRVA